MKALLGYHIRQQLWNIFLFCLTILVFAGIVELAGSESGPPKFTLFALLSTLLYYLSIGIRSYIRIRKMLVAQNWDDKELSGQVKRWIRTLPHSKMGHRELRGDIMLTTNWFIAVYSLAVRKNNIVGIRFIENYNSGRFPRRKWEITCDNTPKRTYIFTTSTNCPENAFESWLCT